MTAPILPPDADADASPPTPPAPTPPTIPPAPSTISPAPSTSPAKPLRLGVLIGGGGRTLLNLHDVILRGELNASIELVIASREDLPGVARARERGLETRVIDPRTHARGHGSGERANEAIIAALRQVKGGAVDLVVLAGYIRHVPIPPDFAGRVVNIHPALLPSFGGKGMYGRHVHEAVLAHGCKVSGCTVHFVDEVYDNGPILLQRCCPVLEGDTADTLAARVFEEEKLAYPAAIGLIAAGRVRVEGRRVSILPPGCPPGSAPGSDVSTGNGGGGHQ